MKQQVSIYRVIDTRQKFDNPPSHLGKRNVTTTTYQIPALLFHWIKDFSAGTWLYEENLGSDSKEYKGSKYHQVKVTIEVTLPASSGGKKKEQYHFYVTHISCFLHNEQLHLNNHAYVCLRWKLQGNENGLVYLQLCATCTSHIVSDTQ